MELEDYKNELSKIYDEVKRGILDIENAKVLINILDRLFSLEKC